LHNYDSNLDLVTKAFLKLEPDVIMFAVLTNFTAFFSEKSFLHT